MNRLCPSGSSALHRPRAAFVQAGCAIEDPAAIGQGGLFGETTSAQSGLPEGGLSARSECLWDSSAATRDMTSL